MNLPLKKYILLIGCFGCCLLLQAQKKTEKSSYKDKQPSYVSQLATAKKIKSSQPENAIKLLETVLKQGKRGANKTASAEAYFLLGNIYEDIDQTKLALQRYQQAEQLLKKEKFSNLRTLNYYHIGKLQLQLKTFKEAKRNFDLCLKNVRQPDLQLKCQEALGDLAIQSGDLPEGLRLYNAILAPEKGKLPLDSLIYARIEAKKAQVFLKQNNRAQAEQSYLNSISNVNTRTQEVSKEDLKIIKQTNKALQEDDVDDEVKINLSESSLKTQQQKDFPKEIQIKENLQLADLYEERGEVEKAESYVNASINLIDEAVDPIQKAAVFKKVSELKSRRGQYKSALIEYKKYVVENDLVFQKKQAELNRQISILETQKDIDLLEKGYEVEAKDEALLTQQIQLQKLLIGFLCLLLWVYEKLHMHVNKCKFTYLG